MRMPKPGQTFRGHYTIERKLGEGAFGRVYEATDDRTGRRVAIKILKPNKDKEYKSSRVKRFEREARVVAALDHPNIVTLYDFGKSKRGLLYTVSEYIDGDDLQVEMQRRGKFPPLAAIWVMRQIVSALKVAHKEGVVHRDLKPANIRVFEYDGDKLRVKVLDFGLAAWSEDDDDARLTRKGSSVGTPRYMSPEQLRGGEVTPAADFYGLGLIAFELLFGMHTRNINYAADARDVEVPEREDVGRTLTHLIERLLRYHVRERPNSASEILALLDKAKEELESGAPADTIAQKLPAYYRPNIDRDLRLEDPPSFVDRIPMWAVGVTAGVIACAIAIGVLVTTRDEPMPRQVVPPPPTLGAPGYVDPTPPKPPELTPRPKEDPTGCGKPAPFEQSSEISVLDGLDRHEWLAYIPTSYDPEVPTPLVVLLHDRLEPPESALADSRLIDAAHKHGFVVIVPRHEFLLLGNNSDAAQELRKYVDWTREELCVDESQILVVGSGIVGAPAAYNLRCEPWVSAVVPVNWRRRSLSFEPVLCDREVPVLSIANIEQQESGSTQAQDFWHSEANCRGEPIEVLGGDDVCTTWECDVPFQSCFATVRWGVSQRYAKRRAQRRELGMRAPATELQAAMQPIASFPIGREVWAFWQRTVSQREQSED